MLYGIHADYFTSGVRAHRVKTGILLPALALLGGVGLGGYLFSDSQPRSFLALSNCVSCYRPSELAGLLASAGIQKAAGAIPLVVKETDRCVAIEHPFHKAKFHFVVFPKKDIKDIAHISVDDQPTSSIAWLSFGPLLSRTI